MMREINLYSHVFIYNRAASLEQTIENQDAELQNLTTVLENLKTSNKVNIMSSRTALLFR
jgi:hypothetical protein